MMTRTSWYVLVAGAVAVTSGCHRFRAHFPHVGWRLCPPCGGCAPVVHAPGPVPAFRGPVVGAPVVGGPVVPDCHGCAGDHHPPVVHHPAGHPVPGHPVIGQPPAGYPPVIGPPMPLPGATVVPSHELHAPAPAPKPAN